MTTEVGVCSTARESWRSVAWASRRAVASSMVQIQPASASPGSSGVPKIEHHTTWPSLCRSGYSALTIRSVLSRA